MNYDSESREKGEETEKRFKFWLDKHNIPYFYIKQDQETFSNVFKDVKGKRPDFMILIPNFGFIFIDVKYKNIHPEYKTYPLDSQETKIYSSLQRKFNLHIWYVLSNESSDFKTWLWIPVSKVLESGVEKHISSKSQMDFFAVPPKEFVQIADDESLSKLFSKIF